MKIIVLLLFVVTCCLQPCRAQSVQNADQTRQVKDQILTSTYLPSIRIKFDNKFKYIGSQKFILYERAQAEQFFFVNADKDGRIKSMYFVQFEGYLPGINAAYNYPVAETVTLGGHTYVVNAESVPNLSNVLKQNPQSDAARVGSFLESKGYRMGDSVMFQRFVRVLDEAKRNEILLIYVEDAPASTTREKPGKDFSARALKGFTVLQ
jgi:hypothetical protein